MSENRTQTSRDILTDAQSKGTFATLTAYFRLSGPGWLQSAITLGGGSLTGALYLGILGGPSMLWLQLVAIVIGVIMLSAIAYVTLSTGKRPYPAINEYVNPVLGVGWVTATILANMIWIIPQFSLCFDSLETSLGQISETLTTKIVVSAVIALLAFGVVAMSFRPGMMSKLFDLFLKLMVGFVVVCFVIAAYVIFRQGGVAWNDILTGFIPNIFQWNNPSPEIVAITSELGSDVGKFWQDKVVEVQRSSMIGVTATAVGINMTFLLPYSMLARKWDKPFRGLARFDLITAMAIPYLLVTSCILVASAYAFHGKADDKFLDSDPQVVTESPFFKGSMKNLKARFEMANGKEALADLNKLDEADQKSTIAQFAAQLPQAERKLAATLVKPNAGQLAATLAPIFGPRNANLVFGLGALAMAFSTIVILMLINGYAVAEIAGHYDSTAWRLVGAFAAAAVGFCWWQLWTGDSKTWLMIVASTFGAILLPIAYIAFLALMNSDRLLGNEKPQGSRRWIWNILMTIGVAGAIVQAVGALMTKSKEPESFSFIIGGLVTFGLLALIGFSAKHFKSNTNQ